MAGQMCVAAAGTQIIFLKTQAIRSLIFSGAATTIETFHGMHVLKSLALFHIVHQANPETSRVGGYGNGIMMTRRPHQLPGIHPHVGKVNLPG